MPVSNIHSLQKKNVFKKRRELEEAEKINERLRDRLEFSLREIKEIRREIEVLEEEFQAFSKLSDPDEVKQGLEAVSYIRIKYPFLKEKESELKNLEKEEMFFSVQAPGSRP